MVATGWQQLMAPAMATSTEHEVLRDRLHHVPLMIVQQQLSHQLRLRLHGFARLTPAATRRELHS
jgi:hypothetical protein